MKTSLKIFFAFSTLAAFAAASLVRASDAAPASASTLAPAATPAADQKAASKHRDKHLDILSKELGLTDDQKAKLAPIMEDSKTQMKTLRADTALSDEQRKAKRHEISDAARTRMRALLTADQQQKFDALKKHHGKDKSQENGAGEKA